MLSESQGLTVVSAPSDKHHAGLGDLAVDLEIINSLLRSSNEFAIITLAYQGSAVGVLGVDLAVGVDDIGRVDDKEVLAGGSSSGDTVSVREASADFSVWCHIDQRVSG